VFQEESCEMLLMDYVPNIPVTNQVIWDLCLGKSIPGKVRIFHFSKSILDHHESIMERVQQKIIREDYYHGSEPEIKQLLCKYGVDQVVLSQDSNYHLYHNNCMGFSSRIIKLFE
jgi:predicted ATP-dependent Lon-type protease